MYIKLSFRKRLYKLQGQQTCVFVVSWPTRPLRWFARASLFHVNELNTAFRWNRIKCVCHVRIRQLLLLIKVTVERHCMTSLSVSLLLRTVLPGEVSHVTRAFWGLHCLRWFVILRTLVPNLYCTVRINIVVGASLREHFLHHNQLLLHALLTTLWPQI